MVGFLLLLVAMVNDEVNETDEELSFSLVIAVLEIVDNCFREIDRRWQGCKLVLLQ